MVILKIVIVELSLNGFNFNWGGFLFFVVDLKKLTLKGLDKMPKVTDTLFKIVLKRMKLTHLILTSDRPLHKVGGGGVTLIY